MTRFDAELAESLSAATFAPGVRFGHYPPRVHFGASGDVMTAGPPGARICCELERDDASRVSIRTVTGEHIAAVTVHAEGRDITHETVAIASALYWSWWRARDMHGEAPSEEPAK